MKNKIAQKLKCRLGLYNIIVTRTRTHCHSIINAAHVNVCTTNNTSRGYIVRMRVRDSVYRLPGPIRYNCFRAPANQNDSIDPHVSTESNGSATSSPAPDTLPSDRKPVLAVSNDSSLLLGSPAASMKGLAGLISRSIRTISRAVGRS